MSEKVEKNQGVGRNKASAKKYSLQRRGKSANRCQERCSRLSFIHNFWAYLEKSLENLEAYKRMNNSKFSIKKFGKVIFKILYRLTFILLSMKTVHSLSDQIQKSISYN